MMQTEFLVPNLRIGLYKTLFLSLYHSICSMECLLRRLLSNWKMI